MRARRSAHAVRAVITRFRGVFPLEPRRSRRHITCSPRNRLMPSPLAGGSRSMRHFIPTPYARSLVSSCSLLSLLSLAVACSGPADGPAEAIGSTSEHLDARVRVQGRLLCAGAPLANVRVDMMDSDSDTDTIVDE